MIKLPKKPFVFLIYPHGNRAESFANRLINSLKAYGIYVWITQGDSIYSEKDAKFRLDNESIINADAIFVLFSSDGSMGTYELKDLEHLEKDVGAILIDMEEGHEKAFKLIIQTLEDKGFTWELHVRINEDPLTAYNLNTIHSALTDLSTKYWLIAKERFADLIEYTQTHNERFAEEAQIVITRISYSSPFNMDWKVDISAPSVAEALVTTIDGVTQLPRRLEKAKLENQAKALEIRAAEQKIEREDQMGLLDQEKQRLELEQRRLEVLEKQLEVQKKGIEFALEIAGKVVNTLHPDADSATRAMEIQALLPNIIQLQNGKGLDLALPARLEDSRSIAQYLVQGIQELVSHMNLDLASYLGSSGKETRELLEMLREDIEHMLYDELINGIRLVIERQRKNQAMEPRLYLYQANYTIVYNGRASVIPATMGGLIAPPANLGPHIQFDLQMDWKQPITEDQWRKVRPPFYHFDWSPWMTNVAIYNDKNLVLYREGTFIALIRRVRRQEFILQN